MEINGRWVNVMCTISVLVDFPDTVQIEFRTGTILYMSKSDVDKLQAKAAQYTNSALTPYSYEA